MRRRFTCWLVAALALAATPPAHALRLHPFGAGLPTAGQWRDGFDVADANGDGHPDIVHGPPRKGGRSPVVFLGDGRGGWQRWAAARFPALPYAYGDARAADLDGDGALDVVLAMHRHGVVVLRGDGRGGFAPATPMPGQDDGFSSRALAVADWDGDGRLDVLALGEGPTPAGPAAAVRPSAAGLRIWLGRPDGFAARDDAGSALFGRSVAIADLDGDGRRAAVTGSSVLGRTDLLCAPAPGGGCARATIPALPARAYVRAVAAGDVDGDGRDALAVAAITFAASGPVSVVDLLRRREGAWTRERLLAQPGLVGAWALALGDVDGDGRRDLVALSQRGEPWLFRNAGGGRLVRVATGAATPFAGCGGSHVELADLDGDGRDEIVAAFATEPRPEEPDVCPGGGGLMAWTTGTEGRRKVEG